MIARYLSSATAGLAVTTGLLWVMNTLIEISEHIEGPAESGSTLVFLPTIDDTETEVDERKPDPVDPPVEPPPLIPPTSEFTPNGLPVVPAGPTPPGQPEFERLQSGLADGALVNIIHAQPEYPLVLAQRGIEGYVVVRFDVNAQGLIENAQVVETSHKGFNKAAVKAVYRSRYKPRVVDGIPQATQGLQKMFRFEIED